MNPGISIRSLIYYRLIALWVISEAMLGGIIHGLKLPVSGLIVGSAAIVCICLLAWYVPARGAILKATLVVAIFKMMLSPQAPPTAYIAVLFQGVTGELIFRNRQYYKAGCMLLAVTGLLESGLQRILVLTIVYGNDLWRAINHFINGLTGQSSLTDYSLWIMTGYILMHLITGIVIGKWVSLLPAKILSWSMNSKNRISLPEETVSIQSIRPIGKNRFYKTTLFIIWLVLALLVLQTWWSIGKPLLPVNIAARIVIRSMLIILTWYFLIGPFIKKWLHWWLKQKRKTFQLEVASVLTLLPETRRLIIQSVRLSASEKGFRRWKRCIQLILVNAVYPKQLFILTSPVQSGKTTSLVAWSANRNDVFGILTPVVEGKRMFMDAHTRIQFAMEAKTDEPAIAVGRYHFSRAGFNQAVSIISAAEHEQGWLIIDEVGPLELRGEGFSDIIKKAMTYPSHLILVVREGLAEKVIAHFQMKGVMIRSQWEVD